MCNQKIKHYHIIRKDKKNRCLVKFVFQSMVGNDLNSRVDFIGFSIMKLY